MTEPEKVKIIEASGANDVAVLRKLVKSGTALNFHALDGLTPLINAAKNGSHEALIYLLEAGADPNYVGDSNTSAAYWAAINCHKDTFMSITRYKGSLRVPPAVETSFLERINQCSDKNFAKMVVSHIQHEK